MAIKDKILEVLHVTPNLTANEIAEKVDCKMESVKVILHQMLSKEKVARTKKAKDHKPKCGPANVYVYSVKAD